MITRDSLLFEAPDKTTSRGALDSEARPPYSMPIIRFIFNEEHFKNALYQMSS